MYVTVGLRSQDSMMTRIYVAERADIDRDGPLYRDRQPRYKYDGPISPKFRTSDSDSDTAPLPPAPGRSVLTGRLTAIISDNATVTPGRYLTRIMKFKLDRTSQLRAK